MTFGPTRQGLRRTVIARLTLLALTAALLMPLSAALPGGDRLAMLLPLCTGNGLHYVLLDEEGRPLDERADECPWCVITDGAMHLAAPIGLAERPLAPKTADEAIVKLAPDVRPWPSQRPRAPPIAA
ncbi:MAG: DUF2946 family protein [Geminicoccaceae bacterium]